MPDYDVQALALAVPPASAPVASYYPAVSVRNNGIHPAPVTGTLRIHDKAAGTLVATLALLSTSNINPGATAAVPATTAWSPTTSDIGKQFLFSAEVTTPLDQVPANNQLSPVTVLVTAEPPTPPPVTVRHAAQHEHDGADEIDVSGLPGVLASGQYPKPHKYTHGIDGDDMLNVDGLPGELHDNQPALAHGNERHTAAYTTEGALTAHNNSQAAHANSANLEKTANKGAASGYANLDASTRVPKEQLGTGQGTTAEFLRGDRTWNTPIGTSIVGWERLHEPLIIDQGQWAYIVGKQVLQAELTVGSQFRFSGHALAYAAMIPGMQLISAGFSQDLILPPFNCSNLVIPGDSVNWHRIHYGFTLQVVEGDMEDLAIEGWGFCQWWTSPGGVFGGYVDETVGKVDLPPGLNPYIVCYAQSPPDADFKVNSCVLELIGY